MQAKGKREKVDKKSIACHWYHNTKYWAYIGLLSPFTGLSNAILQYSGWGPWMGLPGCAVFRLRSRRGDVHARECACAEPRHPEGMEGVALHQTGGGGSFTVHPHSADPQRGPGGWAGEIVIIICHMIWRDVWFPFHRSKWKETKMLSTHD